MTHTPLLLSLLRPLVGQALGPALAAGSPEGLRYTFLRPFRPAQPPSCAYRAARFCAGPDLFRGLQLET